MTESHTIPGHLSSGTAFPADLELAMNNNERQAENGR